MEAINEMSSITRVLKHMDDFDIACLTANRSSFCNATEHTLDDRPQEIILSDIDKPVSEKTPYAYTDEENKLRNRNLSAALLQLKYGITRVSGNYIENFGEDNAVEVGESTFFVVNLHDDPDFFSNIFNLSERYNQDCFLYKAKGQKEAYLIGTNAALFPGYGQKVLAGNLHVNIKNEFITRIKKNSFSFTTLKNPEADNKRPDSFAERKKKREELIKALNLTVYESYERMAKITIHAIYEQFINEGFLLLEKKTFDDIPLVEDFKI